jgi:hypothetical protein
MQTLGLLVVALPFSRNGAPHARPPTLRCNAARDDNRRPEDWLWARTTWAPCAQQRAYQPG